ncbi:hypothetical protein HYZ70_02520 [Candidatus Curtissbacteria bacterium]|nr:hypothetical protein [Candidatus Curtissbacteria bacterium]
MLRSDNLHRLFLLLTVPAAVILFYPSLNYYFFQDDWFVINWVQDSDFLSLFKFRTDIIYWRPLSMPIFFKATGLAFNFNPLFFHLLTFIFHITNSALIYLLFRELKFAKRIAAFIALLYATASFHFIPLSWLSTSSYVLGPTFIFSALIFFLKNRLAISFALFLIGLLCSEFILTFIPVAVLLSQKFKKGFFALIPFIAVALVYLTARFVVFPLPSQGQYELVIAPKIITNLFWYFVGSFNMPEALSTVFYFTHLRESLAAAAQFWKYFSLPILLVAATAAIFKAAVTIKQSVVAVGLFLAGIFPVILLPFHFYPMYVVVASLGIFFALAASFGKLKSWQAPAMVTYSLIWFISSFLTLSFTRTNHWLVNQQAISKAYVTYAKSAVFDPPAGSAFLFRYPSIEFSQKHGLTIVQNEQNIRQALNDQDAMQVIYKDKSLMSFYETDASVGQIATDELFVIWPKE